MKHNDKTREQLLNELEKANATIAEFEKTETAYKKAEEENRKLYRTIEDTPVAIVISDLEGIIEYVNPGLLTSGGFDDDSEIIGQSFLMFTNEAGVKYLQKEVIPLLLSRNSCKYEISIKRKDGTFYPAEITSFIIQDENKQPQYMIGYFTDITKCKQTEKRLIQKNEQMELVMHGANIGWWDWNILSGKEIYNEILPELLGYEFNEIESNIEWWKDKIHPDDLKQVNIDLQEHFDGKTEFYKNEHRLKTKTGKWKWFFDHGKVVSRDEDGKPIRMIGTIRNIDNQQLAEEALRERMNELETFYRVTLGRENRVIELKQEVNELLVQLGKNKKYESTANN